MHGSYRMIRLILALTDPLPLICSAEIKWIDENWDFRFGQKLNDKGKINSSSSLPSGAATVSRPVSSCERYQFPRMRYQVRLARP
jgi:hypothetical protein